MPKKIIIYNIDSILQSRFVHVNCICKLSYITVQEAKQEREEQQFHHWTGQHS